MNELFDYIILREDNEWLSSGKGCTQKEIDEDIEDLKECHGDELEMMLVKAPKLEFITL